MNHDELKPCPFCGCRIPADGGHEPDCYFTKLRELQASPPGDLSLAPAVLEAWNRRASPAAAAAQGDALHRDIMNLPCKAYDGTDAYTHYCRGHRDARHAAAELVLAAMQSQQGGE